MTNMLFAIDPGKTGAIAVFCEGTLVKAIDPVAESLAIPFAELLLDHLDNRYNVEVVIERVNGIPGQSAPASFNFGKGFGELLGVCRALGVKPSLVSPNEWKSHMGLKRSGLTKTEFKHLSVDLAAKKFGPMYFKLAKHDGRAEAALLGAYWLNGE